MGDIAATHLALFKTGNSKLKEMAEVKIACPKCEWEPPPSICGSVPVGIAGILSIRLAAARPVPSNGKKPAAMSLRLADAATGRLTWSGTETWMVGCWKKSRKSGFG